MGSSGNCSNRGISRSRTSQSDNATQSSQPESRLRIFAAAGVQLRKSGVRGFGFQADFLYPPRQAAVSVRVVFDYRSFCSTS